MSKYDYCPRCKKKGYIVLFYRYVVYGYDPNPERGELKRCKYCYYQVRTADALAVSSNDENGDLGDGDSEMKTVYKDPLWDKAEKDKDNDKN